MDLEHPVGDGKGWKERVEGRMDHLCKWECQKRKQYEWGENEEHMERNVRVVEIVVCRYEGCGKVCKSKAELKSMGRECTEWQKRECVLHSVYVE